MTVAAAPASRCVSRSDDSDADLEKRHVAREQHDRAGLALEVRPRLQERVTGPELLFLRDELQLTPFGERGSYLLGPMAYDDGDAGGLQRRRGPEDVFDEGQSADSMQHFGQLGLHPSAFAGGQDDDVGVTHARGIQSSILVRQSNRPIFGYSTNLLRSMISYTCFADSPRRSPVSLATPLLVHPAVDSVI